MINCLWLSSVALPDKNIVSPIHHTGPAATATTVVNMNIILALSDEFNYKINLLNSYPAKVFPKGKTLILPERNFAINSDVQVNDIRYINVQLLNHISKSYRMTKLALKWASVNKGEGIIFVYSVHSPFLIAAERAKNRYKNLQICLIVPDLPEFMDIELDTRPIKRMLKNVDAKVINRVLRKVDFFVLFSEYMRYQLPIENRPYVLMEGICNPIDFHQEYKSTNFVKSKIIMYSGALQARYGIPNLLQAFRQIPNDNFELWITGDGNARILVENAQKEDSRITYFGFIPDRKQVLEMQQQATLLINMRLPSETASTYCFPSKLIEYMASGTPAVTYKIAGIPDEYDDFLFFLEDESPQGIASRIQEILSMSNESLKDMGNRARNFIFSNKNPSIQTKKIVDMIMHKSSGL